MSSATQCEVTTAASDSNNGEVTSPYTFAIVGHELRSALTPIVTLIDVISRNINTDDPDQKRCIEQACAGLHRSSRNLTRLVNDLNDYAALERGKLTIRLVALDLRALVSDCVESFGPHAKKAGVNLRITSCDRPLMIMADETRLQQCMLNLLNNSIKFTPANGEIRVDISDRYSAAVLDLADTGIGMETAEIAQIFEPFKQLDNGRRAGGLGLGLAIVKSIVQLHGGTINAHSNGRGQGSAFRIELPTMRW